MAEPKKGLGLVVTIGGKPSSRDTSHEPDEEDEAAESEESRAAKEDAMRAFMDAARGRDPRAALNAYEELQALCDDDGY